MKISNRPLPYSVNPPGYTRGYLPTDFPMFFHDSPEHAEFRAELRRFLAAELPAGKVAVDAGG